MYFFLQSKYKELLKSQYDNKEYIIWTVKFMLKNNYIALTFKRLSSTGIGHQWETPGPDENESRE